MKEDAPRLERYLRNLFGSDTLKVVAGRRHLSLGWKDVAHYRGERGRRGRKLPRGFQNVSGLEVL